MKDATGASTSRSGRRGPAPALAVAAGTFAVCALLAGAATGIAFAPDLKHRIATLWPMTWLGFPVVGTVIAAKRPRVGIGWLLIGAGAAIGVSQTGWAVAMWSTMWDGPAFTPEAVHAAAVAYSLDLVGFMLLGLALLRFPQDRWPSRRWQWVARLVVFAAASWIVSRAFVPGILISGSLALEVENPYALASLGPLAERAGTIGFIGMLITWAVGLNLLWRGFRSTGLERQQMKWLAYALAIFIVGILSVGALESLGIAWLSDVGGEIAVVVIFGVGFGAMASAIGLAVLRYRLYDVDRVASRTATYAVLTALLAGVYVAGIVLLGGALRPLTGEAGGDLVVAASTLAVAALFAPMRRRIQRVMDRRFNRSHVDAARTVEAFTQRLRDEVDLAQIVGHLGDVSARALEPVSVGLWLRSD